MNEGARREGRRHLRRLDRIHVPAPIFYITCCVGKRQPVLVTGIVAAVLTEAWRSASDIYGWRIGRYVVMPDHVHFFASCGGDETHDLSKFMGSWKRWTRRGIRECGLPAFVWQREFFDHVLRSSESYSQRWEYVYQNPVRAGLVVRAEDWPDQGEVWVL